MSELGDLASDLYRMANGVLDAGATVAEVWAHKTKTKARAAAPKGPHTPHYAQSITYDVKVRPWGVEAEVGPDKDLPQGPLGNIFEHGTAKQPPKPHILPAGESEVDAAAKLLGREATRLL